MHEAEGFVLSSLLLICSFVRPLLGLDRMLLATERSTDHRRGGEGKVLEVGNVL